VIHWLTQNSIPGAVAKWAIIGLLGWIVKLVKQHIHVQHEIRDQLDTSTPGGLRDVVEAVKEQKKPASRSRKNAND